MAQVTIRAGCRLNEIYILADFTRGGSDTTDDISFARISTKFDRRISDHQVGSGRCRTPFATEFTRTTQVQEPWCPPALDFLRHFIISLARLLLMKYAVIIPDGAADHPLEELDGKTPFEVARKAHTDQISTLGRQGTVATTPEGFPCGSDVCAMSLLGYDPNQYHTGRAPLEATALGIDLSKSQWVFRINLVTVGEGRMLDHSAGHISSGEGRLLLNDLAESVELDRIFPGAMLCPGISYRNIMVDRSGRRDWSRVRTTPPHDIPGEPIASFLPLGGPHAEELRQMIEYSGTLFDGHEINRIRCDLGQSPATHVWPWGQGRKASMESFAQRFGLRGAMITAVDLLAGIAEFIGWDRLNVPGQTSYHDTDYAAAGRGAIDALVDYDLVCVHVESPDEAAHASDAKTKVAAIEAIDEYIVGPLHEALSGLEQEYRILYLPDHYTCVSSRKHDPTPVPFAMCGHKVNSIGKRPFNETNADSSDLHIDFGHELMKYFLSSGL